MYVRLIQKCTFALKAFTNSRDKLTYSGNDRKEIPSKKLPNGIRKRLFYFKGRCRCVKFDDQ